MLRKRRRPAKKKRSAPSPSTETPAGPTRRCTRCGTVKSVTEFYVRKSTGRPYSWCKDCAHAYNRQWRRRNLDRARAWGRRSYRKHKAKHAAYDRLPLSRFRRAVCQVTYWAVRAGLISKPGRCSTCGSPAPPARLEAHHPDYTKPLEVIWLCTLCHGEKHRKTSSNAAQ